MEINYEELSGEEQISVVEAVKKVEALILTVCVKNNPTEDIQDRMDEWCNSVWENRKMFDAYNSLSLSDKARFYGEDERGFHSAGYQAYKKNTDEIDAQIEALKARINAAERELLFSKAELKETIEKEHDSNKSLEEEAARDIENLKNKSITKDALFAKYPEANIVNSIVNIVERDEELSKLSFQYSTLRHVVNDLEVIEKSSRETEFKKKLHEQVRGYSEASKDFILSGIGAIKSAFAAIHENIRDEYAKLAERAEIRKQSRKARRDISRVENRLEKDLYKTELNKVEVGGRVTYLEAELEHIRRDECEIKRLLKERREIEKKSEKKKERAEQALEKKHQKTFEKINKILVAPEYIEMTREDFDKKYSRSKLKTEIVGGYTSKRNQKSIERIDNELKKYKEDISKTIADAKEVRNISAREIKASLKQIGDVGKRLNVNEKTKSQAEQTKSKIENKYSLALDKDGKLDKKFDDLEKALSGKNEDLLEFVENDTPELE